jgi:hypothetical protein
MIEVVPNNLAAPWTASRPGARALAVETVRQESFSLLERNVVWIIIVGLPVAGGPTHTFGQTVYLS